MGAYVRQEELIKLMSAIFNPPPSMEEDMPVEKGQPIKESVASLPLVVDLDGTLVKTDLLVESFFALIKQNPLYVFVV